MHDPNVSLHRLVTCWSDLEGTLTERTAFEYGHMNSLLLSPSLYLLRVFIQERRVDDCSETNEFRSMSDVILSTKRYTYNSVVSRRQSQRGDREMPPLARALAEQRTITTRCTGTEGCGRQFPVEETAGTFNGECAQYRCPHCSHWTRGPPPGAISTAFVQQ